MTPPNLPAVHAVSCDHRADGKAVYAALSRAVDPLDRAWTRLASARKIAIKINQDFPPENVKMYRGQRRELVSDHVIRAVLRLLTERTGAEIVCVDSSYTKLYGDRAPAETTSAAPLLQEFGVRYVDGTEPPHLTRELPEGLMFGRYTLPAELLEADAVVSVAKMKNHAFMGVTGCVKNLFGLMPAEPHARPRHYYHHLVRMPYMLADLGRLIDPALNVVDALVGQAGREWGDETDTGRVVDALIAGDDAFATDLCMTRLMGHDPGADWPTQPFLRDRNALLVAAEAGFAPRPVDIDFRSEVEPRPDGTFFCQAVDAEETVASWRRSMCEQALHYRDNASDIAERYAGEYVLLQQGEVRWHSPEGRIEVSRRRLAGRHYDQSLFFKYVDPQEAEAERFQVYRSALDRMDDAPEEETA